MDRDDILQAAAKGNASALEFLRVFARRAHWIDDLKDGDKLDVGMHYSTETIATHESEWLLTLASNQFFLTHRAALVPAMRLALRAWADSEHLPAAQRDVVKGQWHEVVWMVADACGGWDKLRAVTGQFRAYDVEQEPEPGNSRNSETQITEPCKCFCCEATLPEWKYTVLINGKPKSACNGCYGDWMSRPTGKELNGLSRG